MKIKYKKIKQLVPHCGVCGERLLGNGSYILPYKCKCGEWEYSISEEEYILK